MSHALDCDMGEDCMCAVDLKCKRCGELVTDGWEDASVCALCEAPVCVACWVKYDDCGCEDTKP